MNEQELQELREYYDTHDTSAEMENGEWVGMPASVVRHYVENIGGLGDSYDDYRIDDATSIVKKIFDLIQRCGYVNMEDFNKVVDDVAGEMYDENYWDGN